MRWIVAFTIMMAVWIAFWSWAYPDPPANALPRSSGYLRS
jgi:hypothetical protein